MLMLIFGSHQSRGAKNALRRMLGLDTWGIFLFKDENACRQLINFEGRYRIYGPGDMQSEGNLSSQPAAWPYSLVLPLDLADRRSGRASGARHALGPRALARGPRLTPCGGERRGGTS